MRLCVQEVQCITSSHDCPFSWLEQDLKNLFYEMMDDLVVGFNVTHTTIPNNITLLIQALQSRQCDVLLKAFPLSFQAVNVTQTNPFITNKIGIVSSYHGRDSEAHDIRVGIGSTFSCFDKSATIFIVVTVMTFMVIISLCHWLTEDGQNMSVKVTPTRRTNKIETPRRKTAPETLLDACFLMLAYFVKQLLPFPTLKTGYTKLLFLMMMTLGLVSGFLYASMIKTEAVTVKTPNTIQGYQQILDNENIRPVVSKIIDADIHFQTEIPSREWFGRAYSKEEDSWIPMLMV